METLHVNSKVNNARKILLWIFGLVPILAGLDKFLNLLTDSEKYLGPLKEHLPFAAPTFMMIVGVIAIIAGILVFTIPRIGAYIVAAWSCCTVIILVSGMSHDIAVRDLLMALSAFCLG